MEMIKNNKILYVFITISLFVAKPVLAQQNLMQTQTSFIEKQEKGLSSTAVDNLNNFDPLTYSLGPEDVVEITVMNHPEFSGKYAINLDGILQYKFVGDIQVKDLTKKELEEKLKSIISAYVINPSINVTVVEYKSKVIYVLGEVKQPGKYYMRSESIPIREAVVQAGLPLQSAAMRKCRIITPDKNGRVKTRSVDLYAVLYGGNLKLNLEMRPGDVLYVPCTIMAKLFRVISPVTSTVSGAAAGPEGAATAKTSAATLAR
ncbi:MAG: polysaccharide biosynthesis/export family protein [Candidatus Omnitrophota bacterium]